MSFVHNDQETRIGHRNFKGNSKVTTIESQQQKRSVSGLLNANNVPRNVIKPTIKPQAKAAVSKQPDPKTNACSFAVHVDKVVPKLADAKSKPKRETSAKGYDKLEPIWDIEYGECLRILEGHEELVRCIRFDSKRIVSGAFGGKIKVWNLVAALDPRSPPSSLCIRTLVEHTERVFRLQFDEFQIVSSSQDDTILVWDFSNYDGQQQINNGTSSAVDSPSTADATAGVLPNVPPIPNGSAHFEDPEPEDET